MAKKSQSRVRRANSRTEEKPAKTLMVRLLPGWVDGMEETGSHVPTFFREASKDRGVVQVSVAEYQGGEKPSHTLAGLQDLAIGFGSRFEPISMIEADSGHCEFGSFGRATFRGKEKSWARVWFLTNGLDFLIVTHLCHVTPCHEEVAEADQMVRGWMLK